MVPTGSVTAPLLAVKFVSPGYDAVIESLPTANVEVLMLAVPVESRAAVPSVVLPSLKVTVPVGTPELGATATTVAVKVTDWLDDAGLGDAVTVVVVLAWLTVTSVPLATSRIRALPVSAMKRSPAESNAMPAGEANSAAVAGPLSPLYALPSHCRRRW